MSLAAYASETNKYNTKVESALYSLYMLRFRGSWEVTQNG